MSRAAMSPASSRCDSVCVLANVWEFRTNPYPRMWCDLLRRAGAEVRPLSRANLAASARGPRTLVQIQWPEVTVDAPSAIRRLRKVVSLFRVLARARARRNRVLVTLHNLRPHDRTRLTTVMWLVLSYAATDVHVMDEAGWPALRLAYPAMRRARRFEIPHVNYADELGGGAEPKAAPLSTEQVKLLYFGTLRAYKGIDALIDALAAAPSDRAWRLSLFGRGQDPSTVEMIEAAARSDSRLSPEVGEVTDEELEQRIRASDLVVLPYRAVLNSGSLIMALSCAVPALVPDTPTFRAIASRCGPGWVTTFAGALGWQDIERALKVERGPLDMAWCDADTLVPKIAQMIGGAPPSQDGDGSAKMS